MRSASKPELTPEILVGKLPTATSNVVHHAFTQDLEALDVVSVGDNSQHDEFVQVKEERDRWMEEVNA